MADLTFILFLAVVVWLANEINDGEGGGRRRLRIPT
jgi:hypothetical protein